MKSKIAQRLHKRTLANSCSLNKNFSTKGIKETIEPAQLICKLVLKELQKLLARA